MEAKVNIGGKEITLQASLWTWICYKRIFGRDWSADKDKSIRKLKEALEFSNKYANLTEEGYEALSNNEKDEYWKGLSENSLDIGFALDTIYSMAVAAGYIGSQKDLFENASPHELEADSPLIQTLNDLSGQFNVTVKKKDS